MTVTVDLSPNASLLFTREIEEAKKLLIERKGLHLSLDFGKDPFSGAVEVYCLAAEECKTKLLDPFKSVIKTVSLFPLTTDFFVRPATEKERIDLGENEQIELLRRNRLSQFLAEIVPLLGQGFPLHLNVEGPSYWLHPAKFPWIERKKNLSPQGVLLPSIETEQNLTNFLDLQKQHPQARLLTEETLTMEWEGLEELFYLDVGVSKQGMRALKGFEAAGGILIPS